jgi:DNA phosphorothioation-dependent restriction protein DptG
MVRLPKEQRTLCNRICYYANHLHALIGLKNSNQSVNTIVSNAKRFMAYEIIKRLKGDQQKELLDQLSRAVKEPDRKRGKLHQVFQPSFNCKECFTEAFTEQKLTYMHENPCKGKWNLAISPGEYRHSSAGY